MKGKLEILEKNLKRNLVNENNEDIYKRKSKLMTSNRTGKG
jgi:hypothetical protein